MLRWMTAVTGDRYGRAAGGRQPRLIVTIGAEPGWRNHWDGQADPRLWADPRPAGVVARPGLCRRCREPGRNAAGYRYIAGRAEVDDEGETHAEVAGWMNIVFRALLRSSLQPSAQLLWAIDAMFATSTSCAPAPTSSWSRRTRPPIGALSPTTCASGSFGTPAASRREDFSAAFDPGAAQQLADHGARTRGARRRNHPAGRARSRAERRLRSPGEIADRRGTNRRGRAVDRTRHRGAGSNATRNGPMLRELLLELRRQAGDHSAVAAMRCRRFLSAAFDDDASGAAGSRRTGRCVDGSYRPPRCTISKPASRPGEGAQSART